MMNNTTGWVFTTACLVPSLAFAQTTARVSGEDGGIIQWLVAAGLLILVCAPAALNAKRSHLD